MFPRAARGLKECKKISQIRLSEGAWGFLRSGLTGAYEGGWYPSASSLAQLPDLGGEQLAQAVEYPAEFGADGGQQAVAAPDLTVGLAPLADAPGPFESRQAPRTKADLLNEIRQRTDRLTGQREAEQRQIDPWSAQPPQRRGHGR